MPMINVESIYNVLLTKILPLLYIILVLMCSWFFCSKKALFSFHFISSFVICDNFFLSLLEIARTLNSYTGRQFSLGTFSSLPCTHHYYSLYLHPVAILRICCALVLRDSYLFFRYSQCPIFRHHRNVSGIQASVSNNFIVN